MADGHPVINDATLRMQAQKEVRRRLKFPDNADFHMFSQTVFYEGNGMWLIKGKVDAKNALGLTLTQRYECEFRYAGPPAPDVRSSFANRNSLELTLVLLGDDVLFLDSN